VGSWDVDGRHLGGSRGQLGAGSGLLEGCCAVTLPKLNGHWALAEGSWTAARR